MKVLWLCGNPGLFRAKKKSDGGWIGALQFQLLKNYPDVKLINVFSFPQNVGKERKGQVTYYPIYQAKWKKVFSLFSTSLLDDDFIKQVLDIIQEEHPDIIHCWGSELCYGLIAEHTEVPMVLHIQGLLNPYLDAYFPPAYSLFKIFQSMSFDAIRFFRYQLRPYALFKNNAKREKDILRKVRHIAGRTAWDKACSSVLAPQANYVFCSEALRIPIVESPKWEYHKRPRLVVMSIMSAAIYKGIDVILRTAKIIHEIYGDDFEWNVIGINDMRLHEKIMGIDAKEVHVYARGKLSAEEIAEELRRSDVYCHEAYIENSPNSVCEAQYVGVPVVAAMVGGLDTIVECGAGVLVPANDAFRSATTILQLKNNMQYAEGISRKEIEVATRRHSEVEKQLMKIYQDILK